MRKVGQESRISLDGIWRDVSEGHSINSRRAMLAYIEQDKADFGANTAIARVKLAGIYGASHTMGPFTTQSNSPKNRGNGEIAG
jgi:hypothetical protein